jgi:hypothetical protein
MPRIPSLKTISQLTTDRYPLDRLASSAEKTLEGHLPREGRLTERLRRNEDLWPPSIDQSLSFSMKKRCVGSPRDFLGESVAVLAILSSFSCCLLFLFRLPHWFTGVRV